MAKIAIVTKTLNSTSWQLALALKAQQHEVLVLTSYGEIAPNADLQVWAYFKKWSALEAVRLLPRLFLQQIQIFHLVLHEDRLTAAQAVISAFAKSYPNCILTTTLLHIKKGLGRTNPVRYLIEESDIVTCPTNESLGLLRGLNVRSTRQGRGVLPPVLNLHEELAGGTSSQTSTEALPKELILENSVILPLRQSEFDLNSPYYQRLSLIYKRFPIVLWGSLQDLNLRDRKSLDSFMKKSGSEQPWVVSGQLNNSQLQTLFQHADILFLAGLDLTPHELTDAYLKAIHNHMSLVIDSHQARLHADLWKNSINCWILKVETLDQDLSQWLEKDSLSLPESLSENLMRSRHLLDSSLNELNRLYNRALVQLR